MKQTQLGKQLKSKFEAILVLAFFFGYWYFLYLTSGGPVTWDEMLYMDLGLNPRPDGHIFFRWTHIYFQKLFLELAASPIVGARLFWGFLLSGTTVLVYLIAKRLSQKSNYWNGIAAALFFLATAPLFENAGTTYADYTAMFFVALGALVYLGYQQSTSKYRLVLALLFGLVLLAAVRSKETAFVLLCLWPGFAFDDGKLSKEKLIKTSAAILLGALLGQGILSTLDLIFLRDATFAYRAETIQEYSSFIFKTPDIESGLKSKIYTFLARFFDISIVRGKQWVDRIFWKHPLVTILYLITFFNASREIWKKKPWRVPGNYFVWLMPVAFFIMLLLSMRGVQNRTLFPIIPIAVALAAQFFHVALPSKFGEVFKAAKEALRSKKVLATILLLGCFAVYKVGPALPQIANGFFNTLSAVAIILMAVWVKRWRPLPSALAVTAVVLYSIYGLVFGNLAPLIEGKIVKEVQQRFEPFEELRGQFVCNEDTTLYFSANVHRDFNDTGGRTNTSTPWFFNIMFDCRLNNRQTNFRNEPVLPDELLAKIYSHAFLTTQEYQALTAEERELVESRYMLNYIYAGQIVYLKGD